MSLDDMNVYYNALPFLDEAAESVEPPRKIITDYAALEAVLAKDSAIETFPAAQVTGLQRAPVSIFWRAFYPVPFGSWDEDIYAEPEREPQTFNPLPPPPRRFNRKYTK